MKRIFLFYITLFSIHCYSNFETCDRGKVSDLLPGSVDCKYDQRQAKLQNALLIGFGPVTDTVIILDNTASQIGMSVEYYCKCNTYPSSCEFSPTYSSLCPNGSKPENRYVEGPNNCGNLDVLYEPACPTKSVELPVNLQRPNIFSLGPFTATEAEVDRGIPSSLEHPCNRKCLERAQIINQTMTFLCQDSSVSVPPDFHNRNAICDPQRGPKSPSHEEVSID